MSLSTLSTPECIIDSDILNKKTLPEMHNIALSFFAAACGKNRGAFVLDPPDGNTYSCLNLPQDMSVWAGTSVKIDKAEDIAKQYEGGNITATTTIKMLDFLVKYVYQSTPNKESTPYACDFNGLARLACNNTNVSSLLVDGSPIRSATLAGLFIPVPWATGGRPLSLNQAKEWYKLEDFIQMKKLGLNTVQIHVPTSAFIEKDEYGEKVNKILRGLLDDIETARMYAILSLVSTGDEQDAAVAAAKFSWESQVVLAISLPKMTVDTTTVVNSIRAEASTLPLFIPIDKDNFKIDDGLYGPNVYGSLELSHSATVADIASSTSEEDRSKMFYHESTSCMARSLLEHASCFQKLPIFVSGGFDLSIDDCINKNITINGFQDYGQCDRFDETIESGWWFRHRKSFAARQLFSYEHGLGWSFATWKLYAPESKMGKSIINTPAKLLALEHVAAAGLFPDLDYSTSANSACLNPPVNDFVLGDDTLAPSMGPPPDCGDGWWNFSTSQCDFWVPPPPCPVCDDCQVSILSSDTSTHRALFGAGIVGAIVALILVAGIHKLTFAKRSEYSAIPN